MFAGRKEGERVERMTVEAARVKVKPKYQAAAREILEECRAFYREPENERAFLEWKAGRGGQDGRGAVSAG